MINKRLSPSLKDPQRPGFTGATHINRQPIACLLAFLLACLFACLFACLLNWLIGWLIKRERSGWCCAGKKKSNPYWIYHDLQTNYTERISLALFCLEDYKQYGYMYVFSKLAYFFQQSEHTGTHCILPRIGLPRHWTETCLRFRKSLG